jgi:HK97 family phage prohead protease
MPDFDAMATRADIAYRSMDDFDMSEARDSFTFDGHAAVFDEVANLGQFDEVIERGAFRKTLSALTGGMRIPMLIEHNPLFVVASTHNGTLELVEDGRGLGVRAKLNRHDPDAQRLYAKARDGLIDKMSFGFVAGRGNQKIEMQQNGRPLRRLRSFARLLDVSPVYAPAYHGTGMSMRGRLVYAERLASLQQLLMGDDPQLEDGAASHGHDGAADTDQVRATRVDDGESAAGSGQKTEGMSLNVARHRLTVMSLELEEGGHFHEE